MFKEIPATKQSISQRKPVYGVGINDADYLTSISVEGRHIRCPFFQRWKNMLKRCYSSKCQKKQQTYVGCSVCDEWLTFTNFKNWMKTQDWEGMQLDKDIAIDGNKVYSPEGCIFVSQEINKMMSDRGAARGDWPQGVIFDKNRNKFKSLCNIGYGKQKHVGYFDDPEDASLAYRNFKSQFILGVANGQSEPLKGYLKRIAKSMISYA